MTPKEIAEKITRKYYTKSIDFFYTDENSDQFILNGKMTWKYAKKLAKIHVGGIIEANPIIPLSYMLESESLDAAREFWSEVLKEIDNL